MNLRIAPLVQILQVNEWLVRKSGEDLSATDFTRRIDDGRGNPRGNSYAWIFGHIVDARYLLAHIIGLEGESPYAELFARGTPHPDAAVLPPQAEIEQHWEQVSTQLIDRLGELTDTDLDADSGRDFPNRDRTVIGGLSFLCLHESYHVGQLGYLRVLLGHPPVVR